MFNAKGTVAGRWGDPGQMPNATQTKVCRPGVGWFPCHHQLRALTKAKSPTACLSRNTGIVSSTSAAGFVGLSVVPIPQLLVPLMQVCSYL